MTVATTRGSREMVFADEHQPKCAAAGKKPINALAFNDGNGAAEAMMSRPGRPVLAGLDRHQLLRGAVARAAPRSSAATPTSAIIGVALPKGSDDGGPLQAAIQHLIDNGTYAKIVTKWGLKDGAVKKAPLNPTNVRSEMSRRHSRRRRPAADRAPRDRPAAPSLDLGGERARRC